MVGSVYFVWWTIVPVWKGLFDSTCYKPTSPSSCIQGCKCSDISLISAFYRSAPLKIISNNSSLRKSEIVMGRVDSCRGSWMPFSEILASRLSGKIKFVKETWNFEVSRLWQPWNFLETIRFSNRISNSNKIASDRHALRQTLSVSFYDPSIIVLPFLHF